MLSTVTRGSQYPVTGSTEKLIDVPLSTAILLLFSRTVLPPPSMKLPVRSEILVFSTPNSTQVCLVSTWVDPPPSVVGFQKNLSLGGSRSAPSALVILPDALGTATSPIPIPITEVEEPDLNAPPAIPIVGTGTSPAKTTMIAGSESGALKTQSFRLTFPLSTFSACPPALTTVPFCMATSSLLSAVARIPSFANDRLCPFRSRLRP